MTAIKKKRCILLTPHVYLLTYFWEVQSSLLVFSPPYPYGPPFWRKDRKMPKVREWVRCQRRPRFFHFNTWLWFVPAFSVPILKHKLDAIHSSCVCVCVLKSTVVHTPLFCCSPLNLQTALTRLADKLDYSFAYFLHQAACKVTFTWCTHPLTITGPQDSAGLELRFSDTPDCLETCLQRYP